MKKMTTNKQLKRWGFIVNESDKLKLEENIENFKKIISEKANKWIFQLEKGEIKERLHYQGRMSFKQAKRKSEVLLLFKGTEFESISIQPEVDEEKMKFYVMKEGTRIDGPWSDADIVLYIPRQIRDIVLYPFQQKIIEMSKEWDTRHINVIFENGGNKGKTTLCTYMGVHKLGKLLPFCNDYKDILRMCYDVGPQPCYLIDMPRAINKERLYQFYAAIETIKGGYAYDDRYKFQDRYFDCPNIFVFTNKIPELDMLSADRWMFWEISEQNTLESISALRCKSGDAII